MPSKSYYLREFVSPITTHNLIVDASAQTVCTGADCGRINIPSDSASNHCSRVHLSVRFIKAYRYCLKQWTNPAVRSGFAHGIKKRMPCVKEPLDMLNRAARVFLMFYTSENFVLAHWHAQQKRLSSGIDSRQVWAMVR